MITCRLVEATAYPKQPGDMWFDEAETYGDSTRYYCSEGRLSNRYVREWLGKRKPLIIVLPGGGRFGLDTTASDRTQAGWDEGWQVRGEAPNITVEPSIDTPAWHGFLTDGVLTP